ncbi:MAG: hypothetical protein FJ311_02240 [Rhodospirillales bacterium]|nr:hypothetical protein [Rhodospirillales bacterium]
MRWSWDPNKDRSNRRKHGIGFETALRVFSDPFAMSEQDRIEDGEERWRTVGLIEGAVVVLVAHTFREDPDGTVSVRIISARRARKGDAMRKKGIVTVDFDPARPPPLTRKQKVRLKALAALSDEAIDYSDIPPTDEAFWKTAERGKFYRPVKRQLTLRLDADVVAWFKRHTRGGRGYQTNINRALREYVLGREKKAG